MHQAEAIVTSLSGDRATVRADAAVCERCVAGKGCGAGLLGASGQARALTVDVAEGVVVAPGDKVLLALEGASVSRAAWYAYGLPLAGLLLASSLAALSSATDGQALAAGITGLAVGAAAGRWCAGRADCVSRMRPMISGLADARPDSTR